MLKIFLSQKEAQSFFKKTLGSNIGKAKLVKANDKLAWFCKSGGEKFFSFSKDHIQQGSFKFVECVPGHFIKEDGRIYLFTVRFEIENRDIVKNSYAAETVFGMSKMREDRKNHIEFAAIIDRETGKTVNYLWLVMNAKKILDKIFIFQNAEILNFDAEKHSIDVKYVNNGGITFQEKKYYLIFTGRNLKLLEA